MVMVVVGLVFGVCLVSLDLLGRVPSLAEVALLCALGAAGSDRQHSVEIGGLAGGAGGESPFNTSCSNWLWHLRHSYSKIGMTGPA